MKIKESFNQPFLLFFLASSPIFIIFDVKLSSSSSFSFIFKTGYLSRDSDTVFRS